MKLESLLDTDLYKLTMMQLVLHHFSGAHARYRFVCRTPDADFRPVLPAIKKGVAQLCRLRFEAHELAFLRSLPYLSDDFVRFLEIFQLPADAVSVAVCDQTGELSMQVQGPWLQTILFEVPLLALVNEAYFRHYQPKPDFDVGRERLQSKIRMIQNATDVSSFRLAEYGTRRRYNLAWQDEVVGTLKQGLGRRLAGTSNVLLAMRHDLPVIGTMGHEYLQACQALGPHLRDSQRYALDVWARAFRSELSIALTDIYGLDAFLRDFDRYFCKLYDGVRHDSGDPLAWADRMVAHYRDNRIDPMSKTLVFSDGLTVARALGIARHLEGQAQTFFGIGTHLTHDLGHEPLQIVMKMTHCNHKVVAKISDDPAKTICDDPVYLEYVRQVFDLP